ncbi:unnamed protein product, partial [Clonostachys byssicola]
ASLDDLDHAKIAADCDRKRPICSRCQKMLLQCHYYQNPNLANSTNQVGGDTSCKPGSFSTPNLPETAHNAKETNASSSRVTVGPMVLPEALDRSAFKDKILGVYWSSYLPNGRSLSKDLVKHSQFGWTTDAPEIFRERSVLQLVVLTSAVAMMAHQTKDQSLRYKAQRMYGTSLVVMSGAMKSPALRKKPSMLVASALLGIFEAFFGMRICKPCPFASQEWKTVPFEDIPKSPKDIIADITLELPELYSDLNSAKACPKDEERMAQLEIIASKSWLLDFRLRTWAATTGLQIREFVKSKISTGSSNTTMSSEEYALANVSLLYWITCISLYEILEMTGDTFESPWPEHASPVIYCRELAAFIRFLLTPQAGCPVTNFIFFALDVAVRFLEKIDAERIEAEERASLLRILKAGLGRLG